MMEFSIGLKQCNKSEEPPPSKLIAFQQPKLKLDGVIPEYPFFLLRTKSWLPNEQIGKRDIVKHHQSLCCFIPLVGFEEDQWLSTGEEGHGIYGSIPVQDIIDDGCVHQSRS